MSSPCKYVSSQLCVSSLQYACHRLHSSNHKIRFREGRTFWLSKNVYRIPAFQRHHCTSPNYLKVILRILDLLTALSHCRIYHLCRSLDYFSSHMTKFFAPFLSTLVTINTLIQWHAQVQIRSIPKVAILDKHFSCHASESYVSAGI